MAGCFLDSPHVFSRESLLSRTLLSHLHFPVLPQLCDLGKSKHCPSVCTFIKQGQYHLPGEVIRRLSVMRHLKCLSLVKLQWCQIVTSSDVSVRFEPVSEAGAVSQRSFLSPPRKSHRKHSEGSIQEVRVAPPVRVCIDHERALVTDLCELLLLHVQRKRGSVHTHCFRVYDVHF